MPPADRRLAPRAGAAPRGGSPLARAALLAALGALAWWGVPELRRRLEPEPTLAAGFVYVPSARVTIPPYTRVTTGLLDALSLEESKIPERVLRRGPDVVGRVTLVQIPQGAAFQESNLAPRGTRPGLTAGIPLGRVATTLDVSKVEGAVGLLEPGDRLDVIATRRAPVRGGAGPVPFESRVIASEAIVVAPVRARQVPGAGTLTSGPRLTSIYELTLAVPPDEALAIAEELEVAKVRFLLRSGRAVTATAAPEGGPSAGTAPPAPAPGRDPLRPVEIISGGRIWTEVPPR